MRSFVLLGIVILAFALRIIGLSQHPAGFTPDEASFGYDAYSLLQTGKDQWGNDWPLSFKSFGDYKLPLYGYLLVPFVSLFGLNEFAVRLPNALIGTLAVLVTYAMVRKLFPDDKRLAILSAFLLAISPWHIPMSRGAFEANITTLLMPLGVWLFLGGLKHKKLFIVSAIVFGINMFSYHSARLVTPCIVAALILIYRKKYTVSTPTLAAGALFVMFAVIAAITMFGEGGGRLATSGIYSASGYSQAFSDRYSAVIAGLPSGIAMLFNNKFLFIAHSFVENYIQYFSLPFYWTSGPAEGTYGMMPGFGVLYWFESIFVSAFVLYLFTKKLTKKWMVMVFWVLVAPIPAALSLGPGYAANRAVIMLPALHIISAAGGLFLFDSIKDILSTKILYVVGSIVVVVSSLFFVEEYFFQQPVDQAEAMIAGTRAVNDAIKSSPCLAETFVVDKSISEAHIYFAFYNQIDPQIFQSESQNWNFKEKGFHWVDQLPEYRLKEYIFRGVNVENEANREDPSKLVVTNQESSYTPIQVIPSLSGKPLYYVYCFE